MTRLRNQRGSALIITLLGTAVLTILGVALMLSSTTETMISANYRTAQESMYGADAGLERGIQDLLRTPNWNDVLTGKATSSFVDQPEDRIAPDGSRLDLTALTAAVQGDSDALYGSDPNRPVWRTYAYSSLSRLLPGDQIATRGYVVVWASDDPAEVDADPTQDTNGVLMLHAQAFTQGGGQRAVEATVSKTEGTAGGESGYSGQRGMGEQNRRMRDASVQTPGEALTEMQMDLDSGGLVVQ